jgi:hypothetical protein
MSPRTRRNGAKQRSRTIELEIVAVGIDSNYEPVTHAAWAYRCRHVYPYLRKKGFKVTQLDGKLARRYLVAPEVAKPNVDYVTGVGHGLEALYTGDQGEHIFEVGAYAPAEARRKIVHFLSCQTARRLGQDFVTNGCRAYFGYDINFTFDFKSRDLFFACDSEIDQAFADGLTADQVYARVHRAYTVEIDRLKAAGKVYVAATLEANRDHLCAPSLANHWGDKTARIE